MEEINVYTFIHKVIKDCPMEFDGVYEEGDTLTEEERDWIESDDGIVCVFSQLSDLPLSSSFPYEFIEKKSIFGRKGYKHNYYVISRFKDGKVFSYHTTTGRENYEEMISEYDLVETKFNLIKTWDFEEYAQNMD